MLEYIIEHFRNDSQFINDFDGLEVYINDLNVSLETRNNLLREVFEYNGKIYSIICEDNKRLEKIISARETIKKYKNVSDIKIEKTDCSSKKTSPLQLNQYFLYDNILFLFQQMQ